MFSSTKNTPRRQSYYISKTKFKNFEIWKPVVVLASVVQGLKTGTLNSAFLGPFI